MYILDHATVMSGTQSSRASCMALTNVCSPIQLLGLIVCFFTDRYTREGKRFSLAQDRARNVFTCLNNKRIVDLQATGTQQSTLT